MRDQPNVPSFHHASTQDSPKVTRYFPSFSGFFAYALVGALVCGIAYPLLAMAKVEDWAAAIDRRLGRAAAAATVDRRVGAIMTGGVMVVLEEWLKVVESHAVSYLGRC